MVKLNKVCVGHIQWNGRDSYHSIFRILKYSRDGGGLHITVQAMDTEKDGDGTFNIYLTKTTVKELGLDDGG